MPRDHGALLRFLAERARMPFAGYAEHDCCVLLAADAVRAQTDADPLADLRGRWRTARGAERLLKRLGGLEAAVTARLGPPIAPAAAMRGDVGLIEGERRRQLVIVEGGLLAGPSADGLQRLPRFRLVTAWSAG